MTSPSTTARRPPRRPWIERVRERSMGPYTSKRELALAKRTFAWRMFVTVLAGVLALVADRKVGDSHLVTMYVTASVLHFIGLLEVAIRLSKTTPETLTDDTSA